MELQTVLLIAYFIILSLIGFSAMRSDKQKARRHTRRTPENTLMFIAFAGGALGAWIGMYAFRHKTKHLGFVLGVPLLLLWNAFCVLWLTDQLSMDWLHR
ncbi:DUF1294 domain-containing protein [Cohnella yongneupensis]|uniref:DUF1294 domain-containing protein n=1 Tax=Cohnella yongneupensis TaxID=425006 RepID=A0ABW0R0E3_9BACL